MGKVESLNTIGKHMSVVIAIGSPVAISNVVTRLSNPRLDFPNIIAPSVTFLDRDSVSLGKGNIIGAGCSVSCNISIGNFTVINCMTQIGHDVTMGDCNVIMPSCNISGGVRIGNCNFLGVKSIVLQYLSIGNNTRIGAASVVMRNTKDNLLYLGNPAKGIEV
jgi:sugar O-acyltransferase (sialic acid O-acetyltransferase NeuD family)